MQELRRHLRNDAQGLPVSREYWQAKAPHLVRIPIQGFRNDGNDRLRAVCI